MNGMMAAMHRLAILLLAVALTACGRTERPGAPPASTAPSARQTAQCHADLRREGVDFRVLPDKDYGGGCAVLGAVQLLDIGVPVTGVTAMRCGTARAFAGWVRNAVAPGAYQMLGSELAKVEGFGTYACRNVVGSPRNAGRRSGHALANAVDVGGLTLKDGRRITILRDWNAPDEPTRNFLRTIRASACRRFGTVLSPDYNAAHRDHLHLEDDGARFCR
ncbi:extensin family protein [Sphingomonas mollis]|nr:extensin family protein [Sphingomonas sp. BT553]